MRITLRWIQLAGLLLWERLTRRTDPDIDNSDTARRSVRNALRERRIRGDG